MAHNKQSVAKRPTNPAANDPEYAARVLDAVQKHKILLPAIAEAKAEELAALEALRWARDAARNEAGGEWGKPAPNIDHHADVKAAHAYLNETRRTLNIYWSQYNEVRAIALAAAELWGFAGDEDEPTPNELATDPAKLAAAVKRATLTCKRAEGLVIRAAESRPDTSKLGPAGEGMPLAVARQKAEEYVRANGWPGQRALARIVGCAPGTIRKATGESIHLRSKKAEHEASKPGKVREVPLTDLHLETLGDDSAHAGLEKLTAEEKTVELAKTIAEQENEIRQDNRQAARAAKARR